MSSCWPHRQEEVKQLMAKIYADLIIKGLKTLEQVPAQLRAEVERLLANE